MGGSLWRPGLGSRLVAVGGSGTLRPGQGHGGATSGGATVQSAVMHSAQRKASLALAAAFATSAGVHLVRPQSFASIMPRVIPQRHHTNLIYASGVAELVCAIGLLRRARWAAPASIATLVAVFPANVQMALDSGSGQGPADNRALAWGRLPLQAAMIWAALGARPEGDSPGS
jgi:uncharacterized membrane protein